jgi:hypothetical protein
MRLAEFTTQPEECGHGLRRLVAEGWCHKVLLSNHMGAMRVLTGMTEERHSAAEVLAISFRNTEVARPRSHWLAMARSLQDAAPL